MDKPESFNFATDVVDEWAKRSPCLQAMLWVSQDGVQQKSISYHDFSTQSHRISVLFSRLGLSAQDVVMMVLPRVPEWWNIALAGLRSGIVLAPATTQLTAADIAYRLNKSKAKAFVGDAISVQKLQSVRKDCTTLQIVISMDQVEDDSVINLAKALSPIPGNAEFESLRWPCSAPAMLYFTSGTSGAPKMVRHSHVSYPLAHRSTGKHWLKLKPGKMFWNYTEQGWAKAVYSLFSAWNCGASLFIWDDRSSFDPRKILSFLHRYPITHLCAPPLAWRQLVLPTYQKAFADIPPMALERCVAAGEALSPVVCSTWHSMSGLEIRDGYGQTETILLCGNYDDIPIRPGSMGKPLPGIPLYILDTDGSETPAGEEGAIAVLISEDGKSSEFFGIFDGYQKEDGSFSRDQKTFTNNGKRRTWYFTGDKARRDEDGYFWFIGRSDDVINSSGYRIGPFEVESTLKQHPAVAEAAVISSPDPDRGEVVKAFVTLHETLKIADEDKFRKQLQEFCKEKAAPYKYPRKIDFVRADFFPRTISGKIKRAELRKQEWKRSGLRANM